MRKSSRHGLRFVAIAATLVVTTFGSMGVAAAASSKQLGPCQATLDISIKKENKGIKAMTPMLTIKCDRAYNIEYGLTLMRDRPFYPDRKLSSFSEATRVTEMSLLGKLWWCDHSPASQSFRHYATAWVRIFYNDDQTYAAYLETPHRLKCGV